MTRGRELVNEVRAGDRRAAADLDERSARDGDRAEGHERDVREQAREPSQASSASPRLAFRSCPPTFCDYSVNSSTQAFCPRMASMSSLTAVRRVAMNGRHGVGGCAGMLSGYPVRRGDGSRRPDWDSPAPGVAPGRRQEPSSSLVAGPATRYRDRKAKAQIQFRPLPFGRRTWPYQI